MCKRDNHPFFDYLGNLLRKGVRIKAIRLPRERFEREFAVVPPNHIFEFWGVPVTLTEPPVLRMHWYTSPPRESLRMHWSSEPWDPFEFPPDAWAV